MEENKIEDTKKVRKKGRNLAIVALIVGIASYPLFCFNYVGLIVAVVGTILSLVSIPNTLEGRKDVSLVSNIALAVNLVSLMGGFTIMLIIWYDMKQELAEGALFFLRNFV
ncbi:MAG: hypothetical protein IJC76_08375 [Lachnospiraceae bacterium]|nr:hypothetical protein [Lachnospiraceae bacterium]